MAADHPAPQSQRESCDKPMSGLYGASSKCGRPKGHAGPHDSIWRARDWQDEQPAAHTESRLVELGPRKVLLMPPGEAARYDPPMSEWFALPEYDGEGCPECGGDCWGTVNPIGYLLVRRCHSGCSARWRTPITPHDIRRIVGALTGEEIRLGR